MEIDFANLKLQYQLYKEDIDRNIKNVLENSNYVMGIEVQKFEEELEIYTSAKNAISCSNGTDALLLAMMALDVKPGDEIITTPFTFIATAETIALMKAVPVFVDIDEQTFNIDPSKIENAITKKTKAIIPVSLFGLPAELEEIKKIAEKHALKVILDGAQSFGSLYKGKHEVHFCDLYTTSFFPAKPLGCYGDGGAVLTNDDYLAKKLKSLRVHGQEERYVHKYLGMTGRLDTIQAAVLLAKLPFYESEIENRNRIADIYNRKITKNIKTPFAKNDKRSVWAQYTIQYDNVIDLQKKLSEKEIPTSVHYPVPLHLQECFKYLNYKNGSFPVSEYISRRVLSIPINPFLKDEEVEYITTSINTVADNGM